MGNNRARATPQKNRNTNKGKRKNNKERGDIAKAVQIAELAREVDRFSMQLPTGFTPLDVSQFKSTGAIPRNKAVLERMSGYIRKPNPLQQPRKRSAARKLGSIEGLQRAIDMGEKNLIVLAKSGFLEAKTYLEDGLLESDKFDIKATDFMGISKLTEAVMDHTYEKKRNLVFNDTDTVRYQIIGVALNNTNTNNGFFPRPIGGEYSFDTTGVNLRTALFQHIKHAKGPSFDASSDFPDDLLKRSVLFPFGNDTNPVLRFIEQQLPDLKAGSVLTDIHTSIGSITTDKDDIKYNKPTSESIFTRDYQIILNQVTGEKCFEHDKASLRIEIHRKMAVAVPTTSVEEPGACIIPLLEEAIVYFQQLENSVYKNTSMCLVLSSTPLIGFREQSKPTDGTLPKPVDNKKLTHMHVLGDNAFTVLLSENQFKNSGDRHQKSMKNVGIVVGKLEEAGRLPQFGDDKKKGILKNFEFLLKNEDGSARTRVVSRLDSVINDRRQEELKGAKNETELIAVKEKHADEPIVDAHRIANSFVCNQLRKSTINTIQPHMPHVPHWVVSATFSLIVVQIEGTSLSYCFIQSFAPNNTAVPWGTEIKDKPISAAAAFKARREWTVKAGGVSTPSVFDELIIAAPRTKHPPKQVTRGSSLRIPSTNVDDDIDKYTSGTGRVGSMYRSGLPPELELELSLL